MSFITDKITVTYKNSLHYKKSDLRLDFKEIRVFYGKLIFFFVLLSNQFSKESLLKETSSDRVFFERKKKKPCPFLLLWLRNIFIPKWFGGKYSYKKS